MKTISLILLLVTVSLGQDNFWRIYELPTIPEKKEAMRELTRDERLEVWRMNFAWGAGHLELTTEQREFLSRLSNALPTLTKRQGREFQSEALNLFPTGGDVLFGSIGPYKPCNIFLQRLPSEIVLANCPCSVGSSFNMSCPSQSTCSASGGLCTSQPDGCGFLYLYQCNGFCMAD